MSEKRLFSMQADDDLLTSFRMACEANDMTQAQVVRNFMRDYIRTHGQGDLFNVKKTKGKK